MLRISFCASLFFFVSAVLAQPEPSGAQLDTLKSYLLQSFSAPESRYRSALFHIGIEGMQTQKGYLVTAVLEDYPAFFAGVNRGDIITRANEAEFHPISSFSSQTATNYELTLLRGESTIKKTVAPVFENLFDSYRSAMANSTQEFSAGNKVIGYIRLWALSRSTGDLINYQKLMRGFSHCDGLILDLRNAQGFIDSTHIDALLPNIEGADYFGKSVVIIIDSTTSTAAAELARSVKKLDRIVVLGEATADGLQPEIEAPYPFDQVSRGDPQFETALNRLLGTI